MKPVYKILTVVPAMALGALVVLLTPSIIADNSLGNEAQHGDDACSQPTEPAKPTASVDERRVEAETMLGTARNMLRVQYAKTVKIPSKLSQCGYTRKDRTGNSFQLEDRVEKLEYYHDGETVNIGLVLAEPRKYNDDCGVGIMAFNYADGDTRILWRSPNQPKRPKILAVKQEAEVSLGYYRNVARAEYSKTNTPPNKLTDIKWFKENEGDLNGFYFTVEDAIESTDDGHGLITANINEPHADWGSVTIRFNWNSGKTTFEWDKLTKLEEYKLAVTRESGYRLLLETRDAIRIANLVLLHKDENWKDSIDLEAFNKSYAKLKLPKVKIDNEEFYLDKTLTTNADGMGTIKCYPKDPKDKKLGIATLTFDWKYPEYTIKWKTE